MVDMVIVGNELGKVGLSAVAVGGDVSHLLTFIAMGFSSAGQVIIARYIGGKERHKIGTFVGTMSGFLMVCAIALSVLGLIFQHQLLTVMNTPAEAFEGATAYSTVCMTGLVFIYGYNIVSAIMRGMGDSKHPFIFISIAAILNLILDIIFVMGLDMGAGGAALATVISQAVSFLSCAVFLMKNAQQFELNITLKNFVKWDKEHLCELLKLGTPMAIKSAAIQFSKMFVNSWINSYGVAVSAFAGIASKISAISNLISTAMNTAGSTMVGQNIAAGEFERVKKILKTLAAITLGVSAILSVIIFLFPQESPCSFKLACKVFNPRETHPVLFETAIICATVGLMCPAMSFLAAIIYYPYYMGFNVFTFFANWIELVCVNFPFAFFSQLFFIQPLIRTVFKVLFAKDIKLRGQEHLANKKTA